MQGLLILIVCGLLLYGIIKNYLPQGILLLAGFVLFTAAVQFDWGTLPVKSSTGSLFFDFFQLLKEVFSDRFANLGLVIMAVGGFSKYLAHIQSANKLVEYAIKPLSKVKQPYILLSAFYILGVFLNMFITSATGLGLLLMVTVFPILVGMGISKYSAVGMIVTTGCLELGPVQTNLIVASDLAKLEASEYFVSYQLPIAIPTMIAIAVGHFFWQQRCDKKMGHDVIKAKANPDYGDEELSSAEKSTAPWFYALFPLIPFVFVLLFSKIALSLGLDFGIKLGLTTVLLFSVAIIFVIDLICRKGNLKIAFENFDYFLKGMASMLPVVTLVIAGTFFAKALLASGGIDILVDAASSSGLGAKGMTVVMVLIIMLVAALMGSGNASFIPLANIAPPVAAKFGISAVAMLLPMQLVSSMARVLSPIVAVSIACAGLAKISTMDVVKRTFVPMLFGTLVMMITSLIFI